MIWDMKFNLKAHLNWIKKLNTCILEEEIQAIHSTLSNENVFSNVGFRTHEKLISSFQTFSVRNSNQHL